MRPLPPSAAALVLLLGGCSAAEGGRPAVPTSQAPDGFWEHWGDGRAELVGYALQMPRYGEMRTGEAVLITVTESFSATEAVKSDRGGPGTHPVLKLNQIADFQTGVYDYNTMTSAFMRLDGGLPRGVPARLGFSMQEWCGQTSTRVVADEGALVHSVDSYFEGESSGPTRVSIPTGAIAEDTLAGLLRGLTGPPPEGEVSLLPRLMDNQLHHRELAWRDATLERGAAQQLDTPAGSMDVTPWTLRGGAQGTRTWYIGVAPPHLLVGWDGEDGERARMSGQLRTAYWQQAGEGQEALRAELGLATRAR